MKRTYTYQSAAGLSKWIAGVVWLFVLVQASIIAFAAFALFTFISILQPVKAVLENNQQLTELNVDFMAIVTSSIILDYVDKGVYLLAAIFIGCWIVRAHSCAIIPHSQFALFARMGIGWIFCAIFKFSCTLYRHEPALSRQPETRSTQPCTRLVALLVGNIFNRSDRWANRLVLCDTWRARSFYY